jgi:hypothetical protein
MPPWSGGAAITEPLGNILSSERAIKARTKIVTFENAASPPLLAHEITHLIFNEFMETESNNTLHTLRWLNEGLAMYEEIQAYPQEDQKEFLPAVHRLLKNQSLSFQDVIRKDLTTYSSQPIGTFFYQGRQHAYSAIHLWYWQVGSIVEFLIRQNGTYNFYLFLYALKQNKDLITALREAYPARWGNLSDLEIEWKAWL